tara:strand:+ start:335 stop:1102 length:768 start_codon:yes stop_codon:yes gene_type:complete
MLDTLFNKIYVVWGQDPERKEYIKKHFEQCNIDNYEFVRSLIPENLFAKNKPRFKHLRENWAMQGDYPNSPYPLSLTELCCSYGHIKAYRNAIRDGVKTFLVVEDDVSLDIDLCKNALDWKEDIPSDWDIIHFHSWRGFDSKREQSLVSHRKLVNDYFYTGYKEYGGTVCYSLTVNSAKYLLTKYFPIMKSSDGIIGTMSATIFARQFYNAYVFHPFLARGTIFESQIDGEEIISKEFITRPEKYKRDNFDPNIL